MSTFTDAGEPRHLGRRQFLAGGGAILGAALLLGPNGVPRPGALARLARTGGRRLSIGYVEGSAGLAPGDVAAALAGRMHVVPAASLRPMPRSLANRTVAVRLGRVTPGGDNVAGQLDVLVAPARAANEPLPFYAWTQRAGSPGGYSQFTAAVAPEPTLGLAFRRSDRADGAESVAVFTGGRDRDLPKLRPGLYLLGFDGAAWDAPHTLGGLADAGWAGRASLALSIHAA